MNILVFSKDRACQCDLTLTSLFNNFEDFNQQTNVLFTYSSSEFKRGYEKLIKKWKKDVNFVEQDNFKENLIHITDTLYIC